MNFLVKYCMLPYSEQPTVEVLYQAFAHAAYNPKISWVLPAEFVPNPLLQAVKQQFVEDEKPDPDPLFISAGPEFNTVR